jgi:divalent metal cation (Fe/Co/Zn/Cd) transporter
MDWSRTRSVAQEIELWLSLVINSWIAVGAAVFAIRRIGSLAAIATAAHALSVVLILITIAAAIVGFFVSGIWPYLPWIVGTSIASNMITVALQAFRLLLRLPAS